jgi:excinuclease ABC subunit A
MVDDETCKGEGSINVEMVFADVQLPCETCSGKRF